MDKIASDYVKLVLKVGQYDADYIDAYYGPDRWKPQGPPPVDTAAALSELLTEVRAMYRALDFADTVEFDKLQHRRQLYLKKQLTAVDCKIRMLMGEKFTFDEESRLLYDAVAPANDESYFLGLLAELDRVLPGKGSVPDRLHKFRADFVIPPEKLDAVFQAAIAEGRKRTSQFLTLPDSESFVVEYVKDKSWSGYNWYKGRGHSVIQVNTDFPITIDRAVDLACHEGYPGHHVYNALLEKNLAIDRGWPEFQVYVLFSPQSFIAEGSANYGIQLAFSRAERVQFEKVVLFPLAGLDSSLADEYYRVMDLIAKLNYAGNEAARGYLNGSLSKEEAIQWLTSYGLYARDRAEQRIRFIEKYRSYVINYNWGLDMVAGYVERLAGENREKRWQLFGEMLSHPFVPSELIGTKPNEMTTNK